MGVDVLKKLKKESQQRLQKQQSQQHRPAQAKAGTKGGSAVVGGSAKTSTARPVEPLHKYFVSQNWKTLLEKKPKIAPKAAAAAISGAEPEGRAAYDIVAIDCEMVGVGTGNPRSVLARVSIVDGEGNVLLDRFVRPDERVTDYREEITGITEARLKRRDVWTEEEAKKRAAELISGKIVVGHALKNDFEVLEIQHEHALIRDTASFKPLRLPEVLKTPSLKKLATYWLQESIQEGSHDSVQDARTALRLYKLKSRIWEKRMRPAMDKLMSGVSRHVEDEEEGEPVQRATSGQLVPVAGAVGVLTEKIEKKLESRRRQNQHAKARKKKRSKQAAAAKKKAQRTG